MKVLVIIPAYNEEGNLPSLIRDISSKYPQYHLLVVNDCSEDRTWSLCKELGVDVLDLPINLGIGGAVQAGYRYALYKGYDIAVQVDGDGQHDPEYIALLVDAVVNGADLCIGSRFLEGEGFQSTFTRRLGIKYFSWLIEFFTGRRVSDPTSGFRACNRKVIEFFAKDYPRDYPEPETVVVLNRRGFKVEEAPVRMKERREGKSSITALKSVYYMVKVSLAIVVASIRKR